MTSEEIQEDLEDLHRRLEKLGEDAEEVRNRLDKGELRVRVNGVTQNIRLSAHYLDWAMEEFDNVE